jgi:hypothetical protein
MRIILCELETLFTLDSVWSRQYSSTSSTDYGLITQPTTTLEDVLPSMQIPPSSLAPSANTISTILVNRLWSEKDPTTPLVIVHAALRIPH